MKTKLLIITMFLILHAFSVKVKAQDTDMKKAKQEKLKKARQEVFENKWVAGYYGGTKALIGVNFYTMFANKPGLYLFNIFRFNAQESKLRYTDSRRCSQINNRRSKSDGYFYMLLPKGNSV